MLKCPACHKRVLGKDLISGICSHCGKNFGGSGDSSMTFEPRSGDPTSDTIDPFTVSGAAESASGSQVGSAQGSHDDAADASQPSVRQPVRQTSGSEQTFLSDEFPEEARESLLDAARNPLREQGAASGSEQTFLSDYVPEDSVSESHLAPVPGTGSGSEQTFLSDEFVDSSIDSAVESHFATAFSSHQMRAPDTGTGSSLLSDEGGGSEQTFVSDDFSDDIAATMASDSGPDLDENDADRTMASDTFPADDRGASDQTFVSDEFASADAAAGNMQTFVGDTGESADEGGADKTFVSDDGIDSLLKTVESVWGNESEQQGARPDMTLKSKEARHANPAKQTLVIKTKSLVESKDMAAVTFRGGEAEYELIKILGEGGMGVVYDARQTSIDRSVALKMIKGAAATNDKQKAKFLAEAVVTGDLDHPNIVPIYDVGANAQGNLFYSMKKVQGTPWLKVVKKKSLSENIDILMRTADAIGFAHARGVVHRDLKPENIMLGEFGEVLVMDWGLAHPLKGFRKSRSITDTASMGGTPAYMAPEMATGPIGKICPASDIYLLGAILYEFLTGNPPHLAKNAMKCLMAAARNEIAPTDKKGELVDIALKAMATEPKDRYQDVKGFQAAIRDYQSHSESILLSSRAEDDLTEAKLTDDYQHYSRALFGFQEAHELWTGNKRAAAGVSEAKRAYAGSAKNKGDFDLGLSLLDEADPDHATLRRELLDAQLERVARQKRLVFLKRAAMGMAAAVFFIVAGASVWIRAEQQKAVAEAVRATKAEGDAIIQRDIAAGERDKATEATKQEVLAKNLAIQAQQVAESERTKADEQRMVAVTERLKAEEAKTKEEKAKLAAIESQLKEEKAKVAAIEAEKAAVAAEKVAVAERKKAEEAKVKEEYESYISKIGLAASQIDKNAFDAAREVLGTCKPELRNWEWGRLMHLCSQSTRSFDAKSPLDALAVDKTGQRFATGGWDGTARVWNRESGQVLATMKHTGDYVYCVTFSPDGRLLATGSNDPAGFIQIWNVATGQRVKVIKGHEDAVLSIVFSKDGTRLLSSSYDKTARLWDATSGKELRNFAGHTWWVNSAAFSTDESRVVTAGQDGTAIVWEVASDKRSPAFTGHRGPVNSAVFSPDGKQVVTAGYDRRLLAWNPTEVKPFDFKNVAEVAVAPPTTFRAFEGHVDAVRAVSFSPDGSLLLSTSQDNTVRVWDFAAGTALKTFRGHGGRVQAAAFLADGRRILSAAHDNTVREWSIAGYEEIRTLQGRVLDGHSDAVLAAAYSNDQRQVVTASRDRTARTWNAQTGEAGLTLAEGHAYLASTAAFFPDGRRLLTAAVDNTARIWDVGTGGQLLRLDRSGRSAAATLSHHAKWIATGNDDKAAQVWDASTGQLLKKLVAHTSEVTAVAFSPDDTLLATGDAKGHVKLWSMSDWQVVAKLDGHSRRIAAIAFTADGSRVLTASGDNTVGQWEVASGQELPKLILKHPDSILAMQSIPGGDAIVTSCADRKLRVWSTREATVTQTLGPFEGDVFSLNVSTDGKRLIAANSQEKTVRLWDLETGREVQSPQAGGKLGPLVDLNLHGGLLWSTAFLPGTDDVLTVGGSDARLWDAKTGREKMSFSRHDAVASAHFSPKGDLIVTGSWDGSAKIWNATTGKVVRKLEGGHTSFVNTAVFSPDGQFVLTASDDATAKLWSVATGEVVKTLEGHKDRVRSAVFSPDGRFIITTSSDETARLWEGDSGKFVREFKGHKYAVLCAEFSKDGRWLVTGGEDNTARVWNVETAASLLTLSGHTAIVTSVAFSPDIARVISGSQDQVAKLWDSKTGKEILTLSRHTEDVTSVTFSPDGRQVLTGSRDGTAVIWLSQDWSDRKVVADERSAPVSRKTPAR